MCALWPCEVALMEDGLSLLQIWKWPETCAVRLIYCVAFTEMMKQTVALTIYRHAHFPEQTLRATHHCTLSGTNVFRDCADVL